MYRLCKFSYHISDYGFRCYRVIRFLRRVVGVVEVEADVGYDQYRHRWPSLLLSLLKFSVEALTGELRSHQRTADLRSPEALYNNIDYTTSFDKGLKKSSIGVNGKLHHLTATCHMGSHSVTITPDTSKHTPLVLDLPTPEGWNAELT